MPNNSLHSDSPKAASRLIQPLGPKSHVRRREQIRPQLARRVRVVLIRSVSIFNMSNEGAQRAIKFLAPSQQNVDLVLRLVSPYGAAIGVICSNLPGLSARRVVVTSHRLFPRNRPALPG